VFSSLFVREQDSQRDYENIRSAFFSYCAAARDADRAAISMDLSFEYNAAEGVASHRQCPASPLLETNILGGIAGRIMSKDIR
jgi:hypothetical protein